jgi:hypothetical protein
VTGDPFDQVLRALIDAVQGHPVDFEELRVSIDRRIDDFLAGGADPDSPWVRGNRALHPVVDLMEREEFKGAEEALRFAGRAGLP